MRETVLPLLRCPRCHAEGRFALAALERDEREVREGTLRCESCGLQRPVRGGIVDLLHEAPEFVAREAAGLERFAEVMRADGWDRERIRQLPDVHIPYWYAQQRAMRHILTRNPLRPGDRLLDVGANTCWASNIFARHGLEVIALDIAEVELQGLRTADYFLEEDETYFERVLSVMFDPAVATESMDWVFCCEVLHHNDPVALRRTFAELFRVLRPGGTLLVVNEPMRFPLRPKRHHGEEVAQFEGNEHVYFMHEYIRAARAAGFAVSLPGLASTRWGLRGEPEAEPPRGRLAPLKARMRVHPAGRRLVLGYRLARFWWLNAIRGDASLHLVCRRPQ